MSTYYIKHNYREEIILPIVGIVDNIKFFMDKDEQIFVKTADGITARIVDCVEKHIVEFEQEIKEIYKIEPWAFVKKWYNSDNGMQSARFIKLKLKRL